MQVNTFMKQNRASESTFFSPHGFADRPFSFERLHLKAFAVPCYFVQRNGPYFALREGEFLYLFR